MTKLPLLAFAPAPCKVLIHVPRQAEAELEMHHALLVRRNLQPKSPLFVSEPADLLAKLVRFNIFCMCVSVA